MHPDPAASAPCNDSFGVTVDGKPVPVRPLGTIGDLLQGKDLALRTCDDRSLLLSAGSHDLVVGGSLQTDAIRLTTGPPAPPIRPVPKVSRTARSDGGYDVHVKDAAGPFYLTIGQNWDPGWQASIGGRDIGVPLLLDGYSAGWRIDQIGSFDVVVRYAPQSRYTLAILLTALSVSAAITNDRREIYRRRR